jgi:hypothetical protein
MGPDFGLGIRRVAPDDVGDAGCDALCLLSLAAFPQHDVHAVSSIVRTPVQGADLQEMQISAIPFSIRAMISSTACAGSAAEPAIRAGPRCR